LQPTAQCADAQLTKFAEQMSNIKDSAFAERLRQTSKQRLGNFPRLGNARARKQASACVFE
jgi:hypothetical protein